MLFKFFLNKVAVNGAKKNHVSIVRLRLLGSIGSWLTVILSLTQGIAGDGWCGVVLLTILWLARSAKSSFSDSIILENLNQ